jgi:hypothetical protein
MRRFGNIADVGLGSSHPNNVQVTQSLFLERSWYMQGHLFDSSALQRRHFTVDAFRNISWAKPTSLRVQSRSLSSTEEDDAKAAILEKVMKGRQLTDLMLRCESVPLFSC